MTPLHYCYWLPASGGTLLDGFSVVAPESPPPRARHDDYSSTDRPHWLSPGACAVLGATLGGNAADRIAASARLLRTWQFWWPAQRSAQWLATPHLSWLASF